jgi:hypothetical protein
MSNIDLAPYHDLLRADFYTFFARSLAELNGGAEIQPGGHIDVMASRLAEFHDGRIRRLIINVPPRHLKSLLCSVAYPAWVLGHNPAATIICVS